MWRSLLRLPPVAFVWGVVDTYNRLGVARAAAARGAEVTLVSGPTALKKPAYVETVDVVSAQDMFEAVTARAPEQDIIIKAAAVADYRPAQVAQDKVKKGEGELSIPLMNMIRLTAAAMKRRGCRRVGLLATDGTVRTGIYQAECAAQGLEGVVPGPEAQALTMSIIYDEIKRGEKGSREKFARIDRDLRDRGCDGAVLACTELSVYKDYHGVPELYLLSLIHI